MNIHKDALFTCLADFCLVYEDWERHHLIPTSRQRRRAGKLSLSEMLFIMVFFHVSGFRCFTLYYLYGVCGHYPRRRTTSTAHLRPAQLQSLRSWLRRHHSQIATVDQSYVLASRSMDKHLAYVAMTRHREDMKLYVHERDQPNWALENQRYDRQRQPELRQRSGPTIG